MPVHRSMIEVNVTSHEYNSVAIYKCAAGFDLVGPGTRTCLGTGNWSNEAPHCQISGKKSYFAMSPFCLFVVTFSSTSRTRSAVIEVDKWATRNRKRKLVLDHLHQILSFFSNKDSLPKAWSWWGSAVFFSSVSSVSSSSFVREKERI